MLSLLVGRVLDIPEEDSSTNALAGVLGAPLEGGRTYSKESEKWSTAPLLLSLCHSQDVWARPLLHATKTGVTRSTHGKT